MSSERLRNPNEPTEQEHSLILDTLELRKNDPIGPKTREFYRELDEVLQPEANAPYMLDTIDKIWIASPPREMSKELKAEYILDQLPRAFTALKLRDKDPDFIHRVRWPDEFIRMQDALTQFDLVLDTILPITSSVSDRGKIFDYLLKLNGITEDAVVLEPGAGGHYIGKKMVNRGPWSATTIMERQRRGNRLRLVENHAATQEFTETIEAPQTFRRFLGIDILNPDDPKYKNWRLACSLYLDERVDAKRVAENNYLENLELPNVQWMWGDITDFTPEEYQNELPGEPLPQLTFASFVIYLLTKHEQKQALQNLSAFALKSKGIAAVLDDIQDINADHYPQVVARRRDYSSTALWVFDGRNPDDGWQRYASMRTGRVDSIIYEPALLAKQAMVKATGSKRRSGGQ